MTTSVLQERRKRLVNRVGRHLPCNSMLVVSDFAKVAAKASEGEQANAINQKNRSMIYRTSIQQYTAAAGVEGRLLEHLHVIQGLGLNQQQQHFIL